MSRILLSSMQQKRREIRQLVLATLAREYPRPRSLRDLKKLTGLRASTLKCSLAKLGSRGLITISKVGLQYTDQKINLYKWNGPPVQGTIGGRASPAVLAKRG